MRQWGNGAMLGLCIALSGCSGKSSIPTTSAKPPVTRVAPVTETLHGVTVVDNYRWLEDDRAPEVSAWTDVQNRYTRDVLDHLAGRPALDARFSALMRTGSVTAPIVRGNRYFYATRTAAQDQVVLTWREGYLGADRILLDPAEQDPAGLTAVVWFSPSEDGKLIAYGSYHAGDAGPILRLLDVDTAKPLALEIPNVAQGVQWLPDASGFFYQTVDAAASQGVFHRMGGQPGGDLVLYRQAAPPQAQNLPPGWGPFGTLSRDGHWLVLGFRRDEVVTDLWLASFDEVRKTGKMSAKVASAGVAGDASGTVVGTTLFLYTTKGAPKGRVAAVGVADPAQPRWRDVIAERPDAVIENVSFGRDRISVTYRKNATDVIEVFDLTGKPIGTLRQPGLGVAILTAEQDRTEAYLTFTSFNYPPTVFRVELNDPSAAPRLWVAPDVPVDPSAVQVEQVWYPAKDGTRISMFLAYKPGRGRTGDTPTMLLGYGGFAASVTPTFSPTVFQWFEAGGLLAVPNVRGGGEYGEAWHAAGMLGKKQQAFDDFIAAAEWLTANKYTNPQKLAVFGGSHGGLLGGAVFTQRPDLFRAIVARVPVLDMLRYQRFLMGAAWVPEYGSADDAEAFKWLLAYSPYGRVKAGTRYPGVLLTALDDDPAVPALHARKMAAALQAATASNPADHPVLLRVDRLSGLDADAQRALQLRDVVDQRLFIMWQLGML